MYCIKHSPDKGLDVIQGVLPIHANRIDYSAKLGPPFFVINFVFTSAFYVTFNMYVDSIGYFVGYHSNLKSPFIIVHCVVYNFVSELLLTDPNLSSRFPLLIMVEFYAD